MFIQTESTPNPNSMKFLPGQAVLEGRTMDFGSVTEAGAAPLAARLFKIRGVERVFYGQDFISVTKNEDMDWEMLKPLLVAAILDHLSAGMPVLSPEGDVQDTEQAAPGHNAAQADDPLVAQIIELLESRVRPAVAMDGGDITFDSFEEGIVYLHMRGACSGCPSSTATLKMGIENMLRHFVPEVQEVRPVEG